MSVAVIFDVPGMTQRQYDDVIRGLEAQSAAAPEGRLIHVAAARPEGWWVLDVWESPEHLERFLPVLQPLLVAAGVTPPAPTVLPTYQVVLA